jgi:hypothetical protein
MIEAVRDATWTPTKTPSQHHLRGGPSLTPTTIPTVYPTTTHARSYVFI